MFPASTIAPTLLRPVLPRSWDLLLYCCGGAAVLTLIVFVTVPRLVELSVFVWLMFFTTCALASFLPTAAEPILMAFGKLYPPLLIAMLGAVAMALSEWMNYRLFGAVLHTPQLSRVRSAGMTRRVIGWFETQPFLTTVFCALTPVPLWIARVCAVLTDYPLGRFVLAAVLGRIPRMWLIALVGTALPFSSSEILAGGAVAVAVSVVVVARRRRSTPVGGVVSTKLWLTEPCRPPE